ncbi:hypothetical protein AB1Y20_018007 [Prymnesium parvum]|uniref:SET domain-containing protein n=1 Tax=Prymnesium parvum TaxID=97485 RepID=A0AB34JP48_PRYPA
MSTHVAAWAHNIPTPQLFSQSTWEQLNASQRGELFFFRQQDILGVSCPKIQLAYFWYESLRSTLRGAQSAAPIAAGEEVCAVPVKKMLSLYTLTNSSLAPLLTMLQESMAAESPRKRARQSTLDGRSLLAMFILRERARERGDFVPYVQVVLTHDIRSVPMAMAPGSAAFEALSEFLKRKARHARALALADYAKLKLTFHRFAKQLSDGIRCTSGVIGGAVPCPMEQLLEVFSEQRFLEAYAIVRARDWVLPMYNRETFMMVPIVDMLNYGQVGLRVHFNDARHAFVMVATEAIPQGRELLFYYGTMCKEAMIDLYGFTVAYARPCMGGSKSLVNGGAAGNRKRREQ